MSTRFEAGGKTFSHVVHTQGFPVVIQTKTNRVNGTLHLRANERIKDTLNSSEEFLAITNAQVFDADGNGMIYETGFLAINRHSIVWVFEDEVGFQELDND
jgi:hypothetical protein